jgi:hypothetical protein
MLRIEMPIDKSHTIQSQLLNFQKIHRGCRSSTSPYHLAAFLLGLKIMGVKISINEQFYSHTRAASFILEEWDGTIQFTIKQTESLK